MEASPRKQPSCSQLSGTSRVTFSGSAMTAPRDLRKWDIYGVKTTGYLKYTKNICACAYSPRGERWVFHRWMLQNWGRSSRDAQKRGMSWPTFKCLICWHISPFRDKLLHTTTQMREMIVELEECFKNETSTSETGVLATSVCSNHEYHTQTAAHWDNSMRSRQRRIGSWRKNWNLYSWNWQRDEEREVCSLHLLQVAAFTVLLSLLMQ